MQGGAGDGRPEQAHPVPLERRAPDYGFTTGLALVSDADARRRGSTSPAEQADPGSLWTLYKNAHRAPARPDRRSSKGDARPCPR